MRIVIACIALATSLLMIGCKGEEETTSTTGGGKVSGDKLGAGAAEPAVKMAPTPPPQKR